MLRRVVRTEEQEDGRILVVPTCGHYNYVDSFGGNAIRCKACEEHARRRRQRDSQRQKVYDAEMRVRHLGKTTGDFEQTKKYVKKVLASRWLQRKWNVDMYHYERVRIKDGRGTRVARGGKYFLNLPSWARTEMVVLHEIAHMITHYDGRNHRLAAHGREFCINFLALVRHFMGRDAHDALKASFKAHRVKYTRKKQLSPEHLEKLRAHGRKLAANRWGKKE